MSNNAIPGTTRLKLMEMIIATLRFRLDPQGEGIAEAYDATGLEYAEHTQSESYELEAFVDVATATLTELISEVQQGVDGARDEFVLQARAFGFTDDEIGQMLALVD